MDTIFIKTHQPWVKYDKPHFFILSKGINSGKPDNEPLTNSFVLVFQTDEQKENIFYVALSLWKTKFWHPFLKGSVIPFLTLYDFKKEFNPRATRMMREHEQHLKNIQALKCLQAQEDQYNKNIHLINEIRNTILMRYRRK